MKKICILSLNVLECHIALMICLYCEKAKPNNINQDVPKWSVLFRGATPCENQQAPTSEPCAVGAGRTISKPDIGLTAPVVDSRSRATFAAGRVVITLFQSCRNQGGFEYAGLVLPAFPLLPFRGRGRFSPCGHDFGRRRKDREGYDV